MPRPSLSKLFEKNTKAIDFGFKKNTKSCHITSPHSIDSSIYHVLHLTDKVNSCKNSMEVKKTIDGIQDAIDKHSKIYRD